MSDANSRQVALQNLRDFQEMSYADVYALICDKRFAEAQAKYSAVLENMDVKQFHAALNITITTPHDTLLDCMTQMASGVANPEEIGAVGFDLSAHAIFQDNNGRLSQGIEVSLYSNKVYDFNNKPDSALKDQCESPTSEWQGNFMDIESVGLEGLSAIVQQFADYSQRQNNLLGIIETEAGVATVDPVVIARHVAKLLVAIEYHHYMAEFVSEVEVPADMVFIIGENDEIEVPIVFYRVGPAISVEETIKNRSMERLVAAASAARKPVSEPVQADAAEDLNAVDAPPMYDEVESDSIGFDVETPEIYQEEFEESSQHFAEHEIDEVSAAEAEAEAENEAQKHEMIDTKNMLGIPLKPKAFGQCRDKALNIDDEDGDKQATG